MSYQDRKDIDNLYDLLFDSNTNQLKLATYEELEELRSIVRDVESRIVTSADIEEYVHVLVDKEKTITVNVVWDDFNNNDGLRPSAVNVGINYLNLVLTGDDNWSKSVTLDKDLEVKVSVDDVAEYQTSVVAYGDYYVITLRHEPETVNVDYKVSVDSGEVVDLTVRLKQNSNYYKTDYIRGFNKAEFSFDNLLLKKNNVLNTYTIEVDDVEGYDIGVSGNVSQGFLISLVQETGTLEINVTVDIVGSDFEEDKNQLQFILSKEGGNAEVISYYDFEDMGSYASYTRTVGVGTYTVTNNNAYHMIRDCELVTTGMASMSREVEEGNRSVFNFYYNYTNPTIPEEEKEHEYKDITVNAIWEDENGVEGFRPSSVTIDLLVGGVVLDTQTITESDDWSYTFTDLPMYAGDDLINYRVGGSTVSNYSKRTKGYDIVYYRTVEKISKQLKIVWSDSGHESSRPSTVHASIGGHGNIPVSAVTDWDIIVLLPKYQNGQIASYTWGIESVRNYIEYSRTESDDVTTITLKYFEFPN